MASSSIELSQLAKLLCDRLEERWAHLFVDEPVHIHWAEYTLVPRLVHLVAHTQTRPFTRPVGELFAVYQSRIHPKYPDGQDRC